MSTQYRLVQSGKTASGGCLVGQGSSETVAPRIYYLFIAFVPVLAPNYKQHILSLSKVRKVCYSSAELYVKCVYLNLFGCRLAQSA
jgi:hypothetical protein